MIRFAVICASPPPTMIGCTTWETMILLNMMAYLYPPFAECLSDSMCTVCDSHLLDDLLHAALGKIAISSFPP